MCSIGQDMRVMGVGRHDAVGMLEQAGFAAATVWTDPNHWFALIHASAVEP